LSQVQENSPGSADKTIPMTPDQWQTITDAMAQTTLSGTAAAAHLEGIDFTGKTGTAQVVNHSAGATSLGSGSERANAWFVGMAPRRNPDIVVAVLYEHGGWGGVASAPLAAKVIEAFVNKQRKQQNNVRPTPQPQEIAKDGGKPAGTAVPVAATPAATTN
jgi:penicillin-binding protein 2